MTSYLKSLEIENFGGHKHTVVELSPGVNVFWGNNNAGKTYVFKALNWVVNNRPSSGRMLHRSIKDKGTVRVTVVTSEDRTVTHEKDIFVNKKGEKKVKESRYIIDGEVFSGYGTSVPEEVKEVLNISSINIQKQLEGPYLVTSSPGEIARVINKYTQLDDSELFVREANGLVTSYDKLISDAKENLEYWEEEVKKYKGIEKIGKKLDELEALEKEIAELETKEADILFRCQDIATLDEEIKTLSKDFDEIEKMFFDLENIETAWRKKYEVFNFLDSLKPYTEWVELNVENIDGLFSELEGVLSEEKNISQELEVINEAVVIDGDYRIAFNDMMTAYEDFVDDLKKNKVCAMCFHKLSEKDFERIRNAYLPEV
jgi:DNA repair exonuclease SbcCD ATPase subunit